METRCCSYRPRKTSTQGIALTIKEKWTRTICKFCPVTIQWQSLILTDFLQLIFTYSRQQTGWLADMQGISCWDAQRSKNKSGPCFLSKRQRKLNHADSVSSTNWRANRHLCAPHNKLNKLLSPGDHILPECWPYTFVENKITAYFCWIRWC